MSRKNLYSKITNASSQKDTTQNIKSTKQINLYGMTLKQYKEGNEIHSRCFDQIKQIDFQFTKPKSS